MNYAFTLAGVTIAFETPRSVSVTDNFRPFCGESGERCVTVRLREVKRLRNRRGAAVFLMRSVISSSVSLDASARKCK